LKRDSKQSKICISSSRENVLGKLRYFLGMEINDVDDGLLLNQKRYATELLAAAGMSDEASWEGCNTSVIDALASGQEDPARLVRCRLGGRQAGPQVDQRVHLLHRRQPGVVKFLQAADELGFKPKEASKIWLDNQSAIAVAKNSEQSFSSKSCEPSWACAAEGRVLEDISLRHAAFHLLDGSRLVISGAVIA